MMVVMEIFGDHSACLTNNLRIDREISQAEFDHIKVASFVGHRRPAW